MKHTIIYLALILHFSLQTSYSNNVFFKDYNSTHITMRDGLSHNFVEDIYKDSLGFLWVATNGGGLSRYDGFEFVDYATFGTSRVLKSNFVKFLCEDSLRRLWIVSEGGVDLLDLNTMKLIDDYDPSDLLNIEEDDSIIAIAKDINGCIWFYSHQMLSKVIFDSEGKVKNVLRLKFPNEQDSSVVICDIDKDGDVWVAINGSIFKVYTTQNESIVTSPMLNQFKAEQNVSISSFIKDGELVWMATNLGLFRYDLTNNSHKVYIHDKSNSRSISHNVLTDIDIISNKTIIVSSLLGINIYDEKSDDFERYVYEPSLGSSNLLNNNFINCIFIEDHRVWLGTEANGVNLLSPRRLLTDIYVNDPKNHNSLSPNPVNAIYEDLNGSIWIGTVEGGLNSMSIGEGTFKHLTVDNSGLSHNSVSAIDADSDGNLWVGTWGGGVNIVDIESPEKVSPIINLPRIAGQSMDFIGMLKYDHINDGMWIGSRNGICYYDCKRKEFVNSLPINICESIYGSIGAEIDKHGYLWLGTTRGVYVVDLNSRDNRGYFQYRHLQYKLDTPESKIVEKIVSIYEDEDGTLWLGSNGYGLYKRVVNDRGQESFVAYSKRDGLPNNSIFGILSDGYGRLWLATSNGLSCFDVESNNFINYSVSDGLISDQFYWNAAGKRSDGHLLFGSTEGLVVIKGDNAQVLNNKASLRFTRLRVDNKEIFSQSDYIERDISSAELLTFHESNKSFSLEFSAFDFDKNSTMIYDYRLLGFEEKWNRVLGDLRITYTNLPSGRYELQLKPNKSAVYDKSEITSLDIVVEPYFYKRGWFVGGVIFIILLTFFIVYKLRVRELKRQREHLAINVEERTKELNAKKELLEQQNRILLEQNDKILQQKSDILDMSNKVQELTLDKISFFTNITHEFRTPITLIIGPIARALKLSTNPKVVEQLNFVERNSKYLLSLVNQLLDFRKVESGKFDIVKSPGNILTFVDSIITPFEVFASERGIVIKRYYRLSDRKVQFDKEAIHKILTNLLSNAIKFTLNNGVVSIYITAIDERKDKQLYICVRDNGVGVEDADLDRIFNRFYQSRDGVAHPVIKQTGTGIGLHLCKRVVDMLGGSIKAKNNAVRGCSFRVLIPFEYDDYFTEEVTHISDEIEDKIEDDEGNDIVVEDSKVTIMVVEDNTDMRGYIRTILCERYNVLEACNGEEALCLLNSNSVDFIVSDLMMPIMDGLELSKHVKSRLAISHIPILMLTAKANEETQLEGYRIGVDEYMLKPFDEDMLLTRINNILDNRGRYHRKFTFSMSPESLCIEEESVDKQFVDRVMEIIEQNFRDSEFDVTNFCDAMGMSRSLLNKKLQSLMGQSSGQFIRNYRLKIARELILINRETKKMNISEIAYEVGFNDPKYFTRCFTKHFEIAPSALMCSLDESV